MIKIKSTKFFPFILYPIIIIICNGVAFGQNIEFFGCEGVPWVTDSSVTHDGDTSLRSGPIECSGSSILCGRVKGPVDISFWWKNGAYPKIGQLLFEINSTKVFECDSREWKEFSYPLSDSNVYTLKWTFRRISSYPKWEGSAWLAGIDSSGLPTISSLNSKKSSSSSSQGTIGPATINGTKSSLSQNISADEAGASNFAGDKAKIVQNITVVPNITIMPMPSFYNLEKGKSPLIVQLLEPEDESFFDLFMPIGFKFKAIFDEEVPVCTWFIDDAEINKSRSVYETGSNAFNHTFAEPGMHSWNVNCCDCQERCNSSEKAFFYLKQTNYTTIVDKKSSDRTRFIYPNINDAIKHTTDGGIVRVREGNYREYILINRPLRLIGEGRPNLDLLNNSLDKTTKNKTGIRIESSNVKISGFSIMNSVIGIDVNGIAGTSRKLDDINIYNNIISNVAVGINFKNCSNVSMINNIINCININRFGTLTYSDAVFLERCENCSIYLNKIDKYKTKYSNNLSHCIYIKNIGNNIKISQNNFSNYFCTINSKNQDIISQINSSNYFDEMGPGPIFCED
jgi:hypothetical protein